MRRTTICLAIVAVCLGGSAWAQDFMPEQPGFPAEPVAPVAVPDVGAPGQPGGMQQVPGLQPAAAVPSPSQPPQNWQPMETITPIPDVTASGEPIPPGQMLVPGPMMQAAPHGPCCEKTAKGYCCPPNWYLDQRVRVMHHPKPRGTIVGGYGGIGQAFNGLQFVDVFTFRPGISTRTVPFEPAAGYEFTLGRYLGRDSDNRDQFVEFTYYGMNHWDQDYAIHQTDRPRATRNGEGNLFPNADNLSDVQRETFGNLFGVFDSRLAGFNRVDDMAERYASRFDNFELNMRIRPRMRHDRMVLYQSGRWQREAQDGMVFSFLGGLR
ncbi:MAG TPA: hypothetical protein VJL29_09725, partial [Thermoguttaceae bacterium]|nr:hypothetical protein [Thermoguttaceae bacterium]